MSDDNGTDHNSREFFDKAFPAPKSGFDNSPLGQVRRTAAQLSAAERSKVTDALIAQVGRLTQANNELHARLVAFKADYDGHVRRHYEQELRLDAVERGAAVLSAWVRRPFWERLRSRLGF